MTQNVNRAPIRVRHSTLRRLSEDSVYRVQCPKCPKGILLVARDQESLQIINVDRCVACGQQVVYTDKFIGGEPVIDVTAKN